MRSMPAQSGSRSRLRTAVRISFWSKTTAKAWIATISPSPSNVMPRPSCRASAPRTISPPSQRSAFAARHCRRSARWRGFPSPAARRRARRTKSASMAGSSKGPSPAGFRAKGQSGTRVEVRELFFATPARLKFLKSARSEDLATLDVVKRLAMSRPDVAFTLTMDGRACFGPGGRERSVRRPFETARADHGPRFRRQCRAR